MRINGILTDSLIDGPGVRLVVFTQGCTWDCAGCHNPSTHSLTGGYDASVAEILGHISPLTTGITISGGEPTLQLAEVESLLREAKRAGLDTMIYSGATEYLANTSLVDYLKLGPYIASVRNTTLPYRGSENQKLFKKEGNTFELYCPEDAITDRIQRISRDGENDTNTSLIECIRDSFINRIYPNDTKRVKREPSGPGAYIFGVS